MSVNALYMIAFVVLLVGIVAICATLLRWSLKWASVATISMKNAVGLHLLIIATSAVLLLFLGFLLHAASIDLSGQSIDIVSFAISIAVPCVAIAMIFRVRLRRAAKASAIYLVIASAISLLAVYGIRYYVYEAFHIPTNAMAPTLLGIHSESPCPRCGHPAYGAPADSRDGAMPPIVLMNCSKEYQAVSVATPVEKKGDGDRILACKLITPRRWDMIVFRYPEDPTVSYVKRLVGLPGERLEIRDGGIWIDDKKVDPPGKLAGIRYSPTIEWNGEVYSGPGSERVQLGADEYFVLGDFVEQSSDSRFWQRGAPGYPAYAVPESHIVGVVINIYWPPSRWTSFR
jgi:signal peptidase I